MPIGCDLHPIDGAGADLVSADAEIGTFVPSRRGGGGARLAATTSDGRDAMCDYCDCRSRPVLRDLAEDHVAITTAAAALGASRAAGDAAAVRAGAERLLGLLLPHAGREEDGLYPELAAAGVEVAGLLHEHESLHRTLRGCVDDDPAAEAALPSALTDLHAHIHAEEYDLFPAAHQLLDDAAWDRIHGHDG